MKKLIVVDEAIIMWFYLYLLTTSFFDQMGFHMWGYTTDIDFAFDKMSQHIGTRYPDIYYHSVYKMPTKFVGFPFERIISPPEYRVVRDELGLEWYKISDARLEYIFTNASIPAQKINIEYKWITKNNSNYSQVWNHTEL